MAGICNGFQALVKLGLVPYGKIMDTDASCPTLTYNTIGRHQSMLVRTRIASNMSPWLANTQPGEIYTVPISHGEGRFYASRDLVEQLANVVLGSLDTTKSKIIKQVSTFFKSLRPLFSFDSLTGVPTIMVDVKPEIAEHSLAEIFSYMEQSGQLCVVAMDEFQSITSYGDPSVEALLRSHIQQLTSVHFVFSGSQRHVLENMFASANRPFYQSTQILNLNEIEEQAYCNFATAKLAAHRQQLNADVFGYLYQELAGHTWYVQMLLNRLYDSGEKLISREVVDKVLTGIVDENEATFQTFMRLVTPIQARLLRAIAREGTVQQALGQSFISQYHLGATSTIRSALNALVEKELVLDVQGAYQVYDRFFALWLKRK